MNRPRHPKSPDSPPPSKDNPGSFWYMDGRYVKLTSRADQETVMALHTLMHELIATGLAQPFGDYGIVAYDPQGNVSESPYIE